MKSNFLDNCPRTLLYLLSLALVISIGIYLRAKSYNPNYVQPMADAWYFLRLSKEIISNGMLPPKWDYSSHWPYGRPLDVFHGWAYLLALFYKLFNLFGNFSLIEVANLAPLIIVILFSIVTFLFLQTLTKNQLSSILGTIFLTFAPSVISLTMAGMSDNDCTTILFILLNLFSLLYAYEKRSKLSIILAILLNSISMRFWVGSFHVIYIFLFTLLLKSLLLLKEGKREDCLKELKFGALLFFPTLVITEAMRVGILTWLINKIRWKGEMIVNISVAELMPIRYTGGWKAIEARVGIPALYLGLAFPAYLAMKWAKMLDLKRIEFKEGFLLLYYLFSLFMIIQGIRFSLLFTIASSIGASYVLSKLLSWERIKEHERILKALAISLGIITILYAPVYAIPQPVSKDWLETMRWLKENAEPGSLVVTYWDPGHFINYFGFKTTGDGAHCSKEAGCIWDHNVRIQDEARILVTSNETEAIEIIKKYARPSKELCELTKEKFKEFDQSHCLNPPETYFIASQDLLYKFQWLSYYAGLRDGKFRFAPVDYFDYVTNPGTCYIEAKNLLVWCPWNMWRARWEEVWKAPIGNFSFENGVPIYQVTARNPFLPGRVAHFKFAINYLWRQGKIYNFTSKNLTGIDGRIDGIFMDLGDLAIYFPPEIKDSILRRTFFDEGKDLHCFELVHYTPEVKLYKIKEECLA